MTSNEQIRLKVLVFSFLIFTLLSRKNYYNVKYIYILTNVRFNYLNIFFNNNHFKFKINYDYRQMYFLFAQYLIRI